ncbi:3-oxoacyl-[acyl-carrier-protein] synthase ii [Quercus suber]|uniref:beta-ketoacyl-[acyl-carrier-protein] synthase I n=1 Tax=Quercus suber TaxID=58331 RepID=A0AAW0KF81_QUESU
MATSAAASPLCTRPVSACMSVSYEKHHTDPKRLSEWTKRKKFVSKCISRRGGDADLVSNLLTNGSGIQSSWLAFEKCKEYNHSEGLFALLGSQTAWTRKQRSINRPATKSGEPVVLRPADEVTTEKKQLTKQPRVVVTGVGVVTPIGDDADVFYNNLLEGVSGISEIEAFDCAQFPTKIAGDIKSFSPDGWVTPKISKRADKFTLYLLTAGKKALADAGITEEVLGKLDKRRCGVIVGSALGGMGIFQDGIEALRVSYKKINPFCIPFSTANIGSALLAMDLGWMGPNYTISSACATSNFCILNAAHHIITGESDVMLCGGSDAAVLPIGLGGFVACGALSKRNGEPTKASRPWDIVRLETTLGSSVLLEVLEETLELKNRDGFVIGDGAGALLLEDLEHAKRRGAKIYAEFLGGSYTCDAYHFTDPHPDGSGLALCIEKALAQSGVAKEDVNYVNAYGSSTPRGDLKEYRALIHCFGENPELRVNSTKSMTGHLLGASGAVEAIATVKRLIVLYNKKPMWLVAPISGLLSMSISLALCIEKALAQSGVAKEDVNYVNAYGSSTLRGDLQEYRALIHCFGENPELRVNSTKSMTGHLLGASGAVEAVATVKAIQTGWVHPNINLENPDEGMDMNVLVGIKKEPLDIKVALSNSFGFGGHNSSILFAPYKCI